MVEKEKTEPSIAYTKEDLLALIKKKIIPSELGEHGLNHLTEAEISLAKWKKFLKKKPTEEEKQKYLRTKANKIATDEDLSKHMEFFEYIHKNKDLILTLLNQEKTPTYKQSAHYVESKLQYPHKKKYPSLFEVIQEATKTKVKDSQELPPQYIGIRLTPPQDKLMNAISCLLDKKSQTNDPAKKDYYTGNETPQIITISNVEFPAPILRIKARELMKKFLLKDNPSGKDIEYFDEIFESLSNAKYLIRYKRQKKIKEGKKWVKKTDIIEDYSPLIKVLKYYKNLSPEEEKQVEKGKIYNKGEYVLLINPILTDQIANKYVEFPEDLDYRTKIASGSHNSVSEAVCKLRDWLIHEICAKRYKVEINEQTLIERLYLTKHIENRQKKRAYVQLEKAIWVSQQLGIILRHEKTTGKQGQNKYVFELNKEFK